MRSKPSMKAVHVAVIMGCAVGIAASQETAQLDRLTDRFPDRDQELLEF